MCIRDRIGQRRLFVENVAEDRNFPEDGNIDWHTCRIYDLRHIQYGTSFKQCHHQVRNDGCSEQVDCHTDNGGMRIEFYGKKCKEHIDQNARKQCTEDVYKRQSS